MLIGQRSDRKILAETFEAETGGTSEQMRRRGLSGRALEEHMYWDSLTFDAVKHWRPVHYPITLAFSVLALAHIIAVALFWSSK